MTLSVCMITKNGSGRLEKSLASIQDLADEIIVVDTGSTDNSKQIALSFNAKVFDFEWIDDFSAAKNFAYSKATSDWILDLDDDETISKSDHHQIKELTRRLDNKGFYLVQRNYTFERGEADWVSCFQDKYEESKIAPGYFPRKLIRLFKNDVRVKSEHKVHETVLHSIERIGTIGDTEIPIHHFGSLNKDLSKTKHYIEIQKSEQNQDFYSYYQIAIQLCEINQSKEAIEFLMKSINLNPNFHLSWLKLATIWMQNGLVLQSKPIIVHSLKLNESAHGFSSLAIIETAEKNFPKAIEYFEKAITMNPKNADIHYNFSQTLKLSGYPERAKQERAIAAELNPIYA